MDHLAAQTVHQGVILALRVDDDDIIIGGQGNIGDFPFRRKTLAGTRYPKDEPVAVQEAHPVGKDQVLGDC